MKPAAYTEELARAITAMAIREGLIDATEPCMVCGAKQGVRNGKALVVRHHPDLTGRPLWTFPLCLSHHAQTHAGIALEGVPPASARYCWQRSAEECEQAVRVAAQRGKKVHAMPAEMWDAELARLDLRATFEASSARRQVEALARQAEFDAYWALRAKRVAAEAAS